MNIKNWNPLKENTAVLGYNQTGKTNLSVFLCWLLGSQGYNLKILDFAEKFGVLNPQFVVHSLDQIKPDGIQILQSDTWTRSLFNEAFKKIFELKNKNVVLVVDELHNWVSKYRTEEHYDIFVRNCNNRNIGYLFIAQRPQEIPTNAVTNATHRFAFKYDNPSDVKLLSDWYGQEYQEYVNTDYPEYTGIYKHRGINGIETFKVRKMY